MGRDDVILTPPHGKPITFEFARRVGKILSELQEETPSESHYRFYM
jgi:hypothetical protein